MRRLAPVLVAPLAAVLLASGCGGEDFNDADAEFATAMIEHHAASIQMANLTIGRDALDPRIARLAERIRLNQTEEIDQMARLLRQWGEPVPRTGFGTGDGHTHAAGGHDELDALAEAPNPTFGRRWLSMMIEHHREAVAMADDVRDEGGSGETADLAEAIAAERQAELERMRTWLGEA